MKLLYAVDLRGREPFYKQLLEVAWRDGVDAVILAGDLFPHGGGDPASGGSFDDHDDPAADVSYQRGFVEVFLAPLLAQLRRLAPGTRVLLLPGAGDWRAAERALDPVAGDGLAIALDGQRVDAPGGWQLIGCADALPARGPAAELIGDRLRLDRDGDPAPAGDLWHLSSDDGALTAEPPATTLSGRPSLAQRLAELPRPDDPRRAIYVCHEAPRATHCDLDPDGSHGGSVALRDLLTEVAPRLALVGRHTAAPYKASTPYDMIGRTVVANPGQGDLQPHYLTLDTDDPRGAATHSVFGTEFPLAGGGEIAIGPGATPGAGAGR